MWMNFSRRWSVILFSAPVRTPGLNPKSVRKPSPTPFQFGNPGNSLTANRGKIPHLRFFLDLMLWDPCTLHRTSISPGFASFFSHFTTVINNDYSGKKVKTGDLSDDDNSKTSEDDVSKYIFEDQCSSRDIETILGILQDSGTSRLQARNKLEECRTFSVTPKLVEEVLSRLRNDWETAFTFFLWAQNQLNYAHSLRAHHSMISILAKMSKFDTAWALIDEMRGGGRSRESLVTPRTLLIMIRRYCAVHEVGKAINTFYAHRLFKFDIGMEEFHNLLSALVRYKNVKDAEHLLHCNEKAFPFNTKSFNIILNGWCNIIGNPRAAKRVWREMEERGVAYDVISYSSVISCFSKSGNVYEALKLFDQLKEHGIAPDRKVYNAVIHALAKGKRVSDACELLKTMEESGVIPNMVSYNSLIKPLCKAGQLQKAREVFHEMLERGMCPSVCTFNAFFRVLRSKEEVLLLREKMTVMGLYPDNDTYTMLIRKFLRWGQLDDALELWSELSVRGAQDRSAYVTLINGLFLNGKLEEAYKYFREMKGKQFLPEPELEARIQSWLSGKPNCRGHDN